MTTIGQAAIVIETIVACAGISDIQLQKKNLGTIAEHHFQKYCITNTLAGRVKL